MGFSFPAGARGGSAAMYGCSGDREECRKINHTAFGSGVHPAEFLPPPGGGLRLFVRDASPRPASIHSPVPQRRVQIQGLPAPGSAHMSNFAAGPELRT